MFLMVGKTLEYPEDEKHNIHIMHLMHYWFFWPICLSLCSIFLIRIHGDDYSLLFNQKQSTTLDGTSTGKVS